MGCGVLGEPVTRCRPSEDRYFVADSIQCDRFHMCDRDGELAGEFLCQDGLVYGFECPNSVGQGRYPAETDCRAFFTCAIYTNYHPRLSGCPQGSVFDPVNQKCADPEDVPGCENYYNEV